VGVFPEQSDIWVWTRDRVRGFRTGGRPCRVLNLFAYSGGSTIAAAQGGAEVCHLDASRGMVERARQNAARNGLGDAPIRWVVDDAVKFLRREVRRDRLYEGIILDPPSFGRGRRGEVFKIGEDIGALLDLCGRLLATNPLFVVLTCHTPEFSPGVLRNLLAAILGRDDRGIESGEMLLRGGPGILPLPSGSYARWSAAEASPR
jgi:23S rRNA (cytosine1962-C5)-methyltransferase